MTTLSKAVRTGVAAALLVAGLAPFAQGRESRGLLHIKGSVVCAGCSLDEMRKAQPDQEQLYQFTHERGQVVMQVRSVNDSPTWRYFGWPAEIRVRAQGGLFQKLIAEESLFKEVEITGLLSTTRALDIFDVTIGG